jgi:hypothetical protein
MVCLLEPIAIDSSVEDIDTIEDIVQIGVLERETSASHVREVVIGITRGAVGENRGNNPVERGLTLLKGLTNKSQL